ncbi:MAG TPA: DUF3891 family protein [Thermoleophilaceae bacterium]|jgi:hypothetical protein
MVLRREGDAVIAIGQPAHAWLSGQLARAWGNERFGAPDPWEEVCLAAEQHDAGMADWDAAPELNPETGLPYSFVEMPVETHIRVWEHAWERVLPQSRYAALLVSMHGTALYGLRDLTKLDERQTARVRGYLEQQRAVQESLRSTLDGDGRGAEAALSLSRNQRLIWTWDAFSLALCLDWPPRALTGVPAVAGQLDVALEPDGERRVRVEPWPFAAEPVHVRCEGRVLEGRFEDEGAMRAALRAAPWRSLEFELVPGAGRERSA